MLARSCTADVNVIALVGERGREVREFIERDLGDALSRSVPGRDADDRFGERVAMAQREVGLAIGEPPATRGYTPSVFASREAPLGPGESARSS